MNSAQNAFVKVSHSQQQLLTHLASKYMNNDDNCSTKLTLVRTNDALKMSQRTAQNILITMTTSILVPTAHVMTDA